MSGVSDRDWVLCFERWRGARWHVRRELLPDFLCGLRPAPGPLSMKFEDELSADEMCKTCRKRGIAIGEKEPDEAAA